MSETHKFAAGNLYILYHETFQQYGEDIYKIGRSVDPKDRMRNAYTTPFLTDAKYLYVSQPFADVERAEKILFYILRRERIREQREFFKIEVEQATKIIKRLERLQHEVPFFKLYAMMCMSLVPYGLLKSIKCDEDAAVYIDKLTPKEFDQSLDVDVWFEQFRFKPSRPEVYKKMGLDFLSPEESDIESLINNLVIEDTTN